MKLEVGMKAPDFTLTDNNGEEIRLSDFRGSKVLLSWHPIAWTSVCADQMRALEVNFERFKALNTVALGLNVDSVPSKKVWATALSIRNTKLLSDFKPHGAVAREYGIFLDELGASGRVNIILDEQGVIQWMKVYDPGKLPDIEEVFKALEAMK